MDLEADITDVGAPPTKRGDVPNMSPDDIERASQS